MSQTQYREPSGWTTGAVLFAGVMMLVVGIFQALQGLSAILKDDVAVVTENYLLELDLTAWGWIHLLLGVLVLFAGLALMAGKTWGRIVALILATLSMIANFAYIPFYPFWSILMIAIMVWVIWVLTTRWAEVTGVPGD